jgi:ribosomal protein S27AE
VIEEKGLTGCAKDLRLSLCPVCGVMTYSKVVDGRLVCGKCSCWKYGTFEELCSDCVCPPRSQRAGLVANTPLWLRRWFVWESQRKK